MIGTTIGPYEIRAALGAGGMGEVYRARDSKLARDVALKILPQTFAADADRLARVRREAQILASLNHSHIAAIYGLEEQGGVPVLVLELVDGPTLADRLVHGPVPAEEAFAIAGQIAEALEAAHGQGIVHRDLKPANVKLRPDGVVKVLDFGLAKALDVSDDRSVRRQPDVSAGDRSVRLQPDVSASPTMTSPAMTRVGLILGTASYMSPEQARGLNVDRGTDVWAWGCVLFEMLTGRRAFDGADTTEAIAAVVRGEPDWSRLPSDTPAAVRRLLRRCLEKDPKRRLADIRDARFALEDLDKDAPVVAAAGMSTNRVERIGWIAALLVCAIGGAAAIVWGRNGGASTPREMRVEITTPPTTDAVSIALSPDGEKLAFVASSEGRPMLWVRSLTTGESAPLPRTDGASFPFWSPDSRSIGFFANDRVNRIGIDGGSFFELAAAPVGTGGSWGRNGIILFTIVPDGPISRVSETGQEWSAALPGYDMKSRPGGNRFPQMLPDGRSYLYFVAEAPARGVYVGTLDGPERRRLFDADAAAVFVPPRQILFVRAGTLYLQDLDLEILALSGEPRTVARGIVVDSTGAIAASASSVGAIVYRTGSTNRQRQLGWFDRSGSQIGVAFPPDFDNPLNPTISPDGRQVAMSRSIGGNADIWLQDLTRAEARTRLTTASTPDIYPVWSPDGRRLAYGKSADLQFGIATLTMDGQTSPLFDSSLPDVPVDWSNDGKFVLYRVQKGLGEERIQSLDLMAVSPGTGQEPIGVARTAADERTGEFSPDGRWVAFESNDTGQYEIYVQSFPTPGVKTIVSAGGGRQARWAPNGRELFYVAPDARLMSVSLKPRPDGQSIDAAPPVALFRARILGVPTGGSVVEYDVSRDGRFLMNTLVEQVGQPITLILNTAATR